MPRSLYPSIFCSTLVLLGAILLRPGTAQELLDLATQMRGQAPDPANPGYSPGIDPRVRAQFESIPQPATQPMPLRYPTNQPEGMGPQTAPPANYGPPPGGPAAAPAKRLESAIIVARVGPDTILASDLLGRYTAYAAAQADGAPESALAPVRAELVAELRNMADAKILFAEASKTIPAEGLKDIEKKLDEQFEKSQLVDMMQRAQCDTKEKLDAKLHEIGSSLERRRRAFYETAVAKIWLQKQVEEAEVPYADVFAYYQNNATKFDHEAVARWEQLTARFDRFSDKREAWDAICKMGNDVLHGAPFAEVATNLSQGPTAAKGGQRDWTTRGSLKSTVIDQAIFGLPVMAMSQILEDEDGFHIVRVWERKDAYRTPYLEAQVDIVKQLKEEQRKKKSDAYLGKLQQQNPIWTIFDAQGPDASGQRPAEAARGM